jgi:NAD+ kinase
MRKALVLKGFFRVGMAAKPRRSMSNPAKSLSFCASSAPEALAARRELIGIYGNVSAHDADVVVALGGDGFMLHTLHSTMSSGKPVYGMNCGSVGFLMNDYRTENLRERVEVAVENTLHPLQMTTTNEDGTSSIALAINEVYLFRQSYQAAKLRVEIDGKVRLDELICDGLMIATPAGSTAYNLSAHGPILPLEAPLLAMTPVSAFRPRRWRGALLPNQVRVDIHILEPDKRPVNAVADNMEVKSVLHVQIAQSQEMTARILSDPDHSWSDRIVAEQFNN